MDSLSQKQHRRSIRLPAYDYSQPGAYFITLVTQGRINLFGEVIHDEVQLSVRGVVADEYWRAIPDHFPNAELGAYVVMPNHVHGIIILHERADADAFRAAIPSPHVVGATHAQHRSADWVAPTKDAPTKRMTRPKGPKRGSIGAIIGAYKMSVTRRIVQQQGGIPHIWQRNYYERIIRDEAEHNRIRLYIESNPVYWLEDEENT